MIKGFVDDFETAEAVVTIFAVVVFMRFVAATDCFDIDEDGGTETPITVVVPTFTGAVIVDPAVGADLVCCC